MKLDTKENEKWKRTNEFKIKIKWKIMKRNNEYENNENENLKSEQENYEN